ncbi:hypothetical protein S245_047870, partial [Arachis hypogaea]
NFAMWFRPTADMSLTRDECLLGMYIFAKNEEMRETKNLFKHYELTLPRGSSTLLQCFPLFKPRQTLYPVAGSSCQHLPPRSCSKLRWNM